MIVGLTETEFVRTAPDSDSFTCTLPNQRHPNRSKPDHLHAVPEVSNGVSDFRES